MIWKVIGIFSLGRKSLKREYPGCHSPKEMSGKLVQWAEKKAARVFMGSNAQMHGAYSRWMDGWIGEWMDE